MILIRVFLLDDTWFAEWLAGCDLVVEAITFAEALALEALL